MNAQNLEQTPDKFMLRAMVNQVVDDAYVVWGRLNKRKIKLLGGVLHSRYGISREEAQEHISFSLSRFPRN